MKYIKSNQEIRAENEARIEGIVERNMDRLDRQLMNNRITQEQYDKEVKELDSWSRSALSSATV